MKQLYIILILITMTFPQSTLAAETQTPISHLIVIMQENHSFDNYFGTYPTANGTISAPIASQLEPVNGIPNGTCLPYGRSCIKPYYADASNTVDPYEGQLVYEEDVNNGAMDGFAMYSGPQSMAYYDYHQLAAYWDYAEEYAIADNYFSTYLATTVPNRLSVIAGESVVSGNYGPPPYLNFNNTVFSQLTTAGISWAYFEDLTGFGGAAQVYPLVYIAGLPQQNVQNLSSLMHYLTTGNGLPAVSFVSSIGTRALDEHPPYNVTEGEVWAVSIINAVMNSKYWNSSAIFLTYDEGGGYFDHVSPPQIMSLNKNFSYPLLSYGQRVPFIVISPYAKENYVSETLLSHLSITHFIEYNWKLRPLNSAVAQANLPLDMFYFEGEPRAPLILSSNGNFSYAKYPIPLQIPLNQLPYQRTGSLVTSPDQYLVPDLQIGVLALVTAAAIFFFSLSIRKARRERKI
ncbi:MAG: alkaline phosphatase family protein [Conexivisphaerales archaeon]